jgi:phage shock protein A
MDPVFGNRWKLAPFQHSGKARHGDGNDPRPDPKKLLSIGCRIWKLESEFRAIGQDTSSVGANRSAANRQKNKLASRICRLKKKALHAANKIKLDGLKQEHNQLMEVIKSIVAEMERTISAGDVGNKNLCQSLDQLIRQHLTFMIAGHTTDYVNSELEKVAAQVVSGKHVR